MSANDKAKVDPVEEWHVIPDPPVQNQPAYGKWYDRTQQLAKAIREGDQELAVQLARLWWAGDREVAGLR